VKAMNLRQAEQRLGNIRWPDGTLRREIVDYDYSPLMGKWRLHPDKTSYEFVLAPVWYERCMVGHAAVMLGLAPT
jgi:hypothetical protein